MTENGWQQETIPMRYFAALRHVEFDIEHDVHDQELRIVPYVS
jgi:hypothetical protein